jgi:monoamine oxidase
VLTHSLAGGGYTELGGMFTGPTQDRIQALAQSVGVGTYPTYNVGNNVFIGANGRRSTYPNDSPLGSAPLDPVVAPDIVLAVTLLDQMAASRSSCRSSTLYSTSRRRGTSRTSAPSSATSTPAAARRSSVSSAGRRRSRSGSRPGSTAAFCSGSP